MSWGLGENEFRLCRKCGLGVWVSGTCEGCVGIWFLTLRLLRVASGEFLSKYFLFLEGNWRVFAVGERHFLQTIVH